MNGLRRYLSDGKRTLLGVGPMSKTCIEAAALLSKQYDVPLQLIASRRQIDSGAFGGGYVENMDTAGFARFVRSLGADKLYLVRDHGGPWQSTVEQERRLSPLDAMKSALVSFEDDIVNGFDFIHIDPSIAIGDEVLTPALIMERVMELYAACCAIARKAGQLDRIAFELGTEEQSGYGTNLADMDDFMVRVRSFCETNGFPLPLFIVAQTGTKVMESRNIGIFANETGQVNPEFLDHLSKTVALFGKHGFLLKEHNADYLNDRALALRPFLGINASNVAPEFGVTETCGLLYALRAKGLKSEFDRFVEIALASDKWRKWMLPGSTATDIDKAIICGHYVYADPRIKEIRQALIRAESTVETYLSRLVQQSILRYLHLFNGLQKGAPC